MPESAGRQSGTAQKPAENRPYTALARQGRILSVVLAYAAFAGLWMLLSDKAMSWLSASPAPITLSGAIKDLFFVLATSLLLYISMRRQPDSAAPATPFPPARFRPTLPFVLFASAIFALTAMEIDRTFSVQRDKETLKLQSIATLKAQQIADWLKETQEYAEFLQTSQLFAVNYQPGRQEALEILEKQLAQLRRNGGFTAILRLAANGEPLRGGSGVQFDFAPAFLDAAHLALADHQVHRAGPYRDQADRLKLDFIVPLTAFRENSLLVVFQTDWNYWLSHSLQTWPEPNSSGEIMLFRNDGEQIQLLNEPLSRMETAAKPGFPLSDKQPPAPEILQDQIGTGSLVEGTDYRRATVIGAIQAIPGTDWFLLAKMDRSELYADAAEDAILTVIAGLLALFAAGAGFHLQQQRQQINLAAKIQLSQEERLRALRLLAAIADCSDDAIYAKDTEGRYILFNGAASRFVGKPAEQVLGHDDRYIFPSEQAEELMAVGRLVIAENRIHTAEEVLDTTDGKRIFMATKGPLRDSDGKVIGIYGISRDITAQKRSEAALRASELSYRSLFENMLNGYAYCRMLYENGRPNDFVYLDVNNAFETLTGLRDVVGRKASEVIPGIRESDPGLIEIYGRIAMGGQPEQFEIHVNALRMWFLISVYSPQPEHFAAVFAVITERKQAELQLRISEERLQLALEATNDGLWDLDLRTGLAYLTPRYYEMTGYRAEDVTPDSEFLNRIVHADDRPHVQKIMDASLQGKIPVSEIDYRLVTPAGEIKWMRGRGKVVERDADGVPLRMVGTITDIGLHKAAEAAIRRQTRELALRNAELERFNRAAVGRELDMIALKKRLNALCRELGREPPYPLAFLDTPSASPE